MNNELYVAIYCATLFWLPPAWVAGLAVGEIGLFQATAFSLTGFMALILIFRVLLFMPSRNDTFLGRVGVLLHSGLRYLAIGWVALGGGVHLAFIVLTWIPLVTVIFAPHAVFESEYPILSLIQVLTTSAGFFAAYLLKLIVVKAFRFLVQGKNYSISSAFRTHVSNSEKPVMILTSPIGNPISLAFMLALSVNWALFHSGHHGY